jgi:hypothetical protein
MQTHQRLGTPVLAVHAGLMRLIGQKWLRRRMDIACCIAKVKQVIGIGRRHF